MKRTVMSIVLAIALFTPATTWSAPMGATNLTESATSTEALYRGSDDSWVPFEELTTAEQEDFFAREEEALAREEEAEALFDRVNTLVSEGQEFEEIWSSFSDTERELAHLIFEPASIVANNDAESVLPKISAPDLPGTNGGCSSRRDCVESRNINGWLLWKHCQNVDWYYDGRKITWVSTICNVEAHSGWEFQGFIEYATTGGVGYSEFWYYTEGFYCYSPFGWCMNHDMPWIKQTCRANGSSSSTWGNAG